MLGGADPGTFLVNYGASDMIHIVDQYINNYAVNRYTYAGGITTNYNTSLTLQDQDIYNIVHSAAAAYGTGYGKMYHVFLQSGVQQCSQSAGGCYQTNYCAYHGNVTFSDIGHVIYSVEPYQGITACADGGSLTDSTASTLSHEVTEAITDPDVPQNLAWYSYGYGGEIGDICRFNHFGSVTLNGTSYYIQQEYSNVPSACTFTPPAAWHATGGYAVDVGATDGVAWAVPWDGSLWYQTTGVWTKTNGASATRVEVSPLGTAWAVLTDETIWHFTSGYWQRLGCCGVDLGVGPSDDPWIIGADGLTPFHYVSGQWQQLPGQFTRITVSPEGVAYALSPGDKKIWYYDPASTSWKYFACCANDIGVGSNQNMWVIGDGNTVWHWLGSSWALIAGSGTSIAVTPSGVPYVTEAGTNAIKYYR